MMGMCRVSGSPFNRRVASHTVDARQAEVHQDEVGVLGVREVAIACAPSTASTMR